MLADPEVTVNCVLSKLAKPLTEVVAVGIAVAEAAVTKPLAFTVKLGIVTESPKLPMFELTVASVSAALTAALPSTALSVAVASPVKLKLRAVAQRVAVEALPLSAP